MHTTAEHAPAGQYLVKGMEERHRRGVVDVFNYYVQNSFAAYPDTTVGYEFFDTLLGMCQAHGALVAETANGEVVGFALLKAYHPAPTFSHTAEVSYFIRQRIPARGSARCCSIASLQWRSLAASPAWSPASHPATARASSFITSGGSPNVVISATSE